MSVEFRVLVVKKGNGYWCRRSWWIWTESRKRRWKERTGADAIDVDPRPTQTHKNLKSSNMYVGQLPFHGGKGSKADC